MRRILSILGRSERTVLPHEQCRSPGCSNPRRGPMELGGELCDECYRDQRELAHLRNDVPLGLADSVWERRCFDCGHRRYLSKRGRGPPDAVCPECEGTNVENTDLTKIGSDTNV